jgi:hypothetical protein
MCSMLSFRLLTYFSIVSPFGQGRGKIAGVIVCFAGC